MTCDMLDGNAALLHQNHNVKCERTHTNVQTYCTHTNNLSNLWHFGLKERTSSCHTEPVMWIEDHKRDTETLAGSLLVLLGCWGTIQPAWHLSGTSGKCEPGPEPLSCSPTSPAACSSPRPASGATAAGRPAGAGPPQTRAAHSWPAAAHSPLRTCTTIWMADVFKALNGRNAKTETFWNQDKTLKSSFGNLPADLLLQGSVFVDESLGLLQIIGQLVWGSGRLRLDQPGQEWVQVLAGRKSLSVSCLGTWPRFVQWP